MLAEARRTHGRGAWAQVTILVALALTLAIWLPAGSAWARDFPKDARRGAITAFRHPDIVIGKVTYRMVPATRIRNEQNLIVLPQAMPARREVMFQLDFSGNIREMWILTEEEVKVLGPAPKQ